ncbi:hypothetical protein K469DRAFT_742079 [Zopfia rhizophila CBS 207.26]|uniref:MFS general substrate transporter n=1 Tax=Zopfia rhizophila CBS 207.26 TaxID=1314779 RepID=A0A6A6DIC6_9PEZI|nr:hypothetical protein K469DRAFT_742079 [Zopfia rhizophila CBS 207.26]
MTGPEREKPSIIHSESLHKPDADNATTNIIGLETSEDTLPKGYFYSKYFIGSWLAIGVSLRASTGAFGYAAPILVFINADLEPDPQYIWVSVICATSTMIPVLTDGNVFLGVASATQLSFHFAISELVPMKCCYIAVGSIYPFSIGGSGFSPAIAYAFVVKYPGVSWRGIYWLLLALNGTAFVCWVFFYFPSTFEQRHKSDINSKIHWIKHFDYVGTAIFAASFVVFLMGLSWGRSVYSWNSAAETYAPLKEPLIPMHIFANFAWTSSVILLGLGASIYYAFSIVWPNQVAVLYSKPGDPMYTGYPAVIIGMRFITGQIFAGMITFLVGGATAGQPNNKATVIALIFLDRVFIGWNESVTLANVTILVCDQKDIGVAGGTAGAFRAGLCAILTAIYIAIMTNRLTSEISAQVPSALVSSSLPASSIPDFMTALTSGSTSAFETVQGISTEIIGVGVTAYKQANADAYRTVYLSTIAFTGIALILSYWAPDTEKF